MKKMKKWIPLVSICCALPILVLVALSIFGERKSVSGTLLGQEVPILGRTHVPAGNRVEYNSNPPTSGDHWPQPAEWGVYDFTLHDEQLVHNLEHGGIVISYKDVDGQTETKLKALAQKYPQAALVHPRPKKDTKIAVASWGRLLQLEAGEEAKIEQFIRTNINNSPEPLASLEPLAIRVGVPFPDFSLQEVGGRTITKDLLKSTPAIVWFTTSWCVPCQIGALKVAELDNTLGGRAFNVLVVFVDLKESGVDLKNWREQFANPDWIVAFDNPQAKLAERVGLRFLDSKFILDQEGVIQNIDVKIADDHYLNELKRIVNLSG